MTTPFPEQVTPGGVLIFPQIKSPNYVPGVSGWAIFSNGNVEFNSGTFRGTISGGTFAGTDFVINSAGAFFYSGAPALGNLIASLAAASGFDAQGNLYLAGNVGYTFIGAEPAYYAVVSSANGVSVFRATTQAGPWSQVGGFAYLHGGFAGIQLYDQASGASLTVGDTVDGAGNVFAALAAVLSMYPAIGTPTQPVAGNSLLYASANGTPFAQTAKGLAGSQPIRQADSASHTQTNIVSPSFGNVTAAWTIPANDPQVNTIYEVEMPFTSLFEGIQLNIGINFAGTFTNVVPVAAAAFTAGHSLVGTVKLKLTFTATGAGGSANIDMSGEVCDSGAARAPGTSAALDGHTTLAIDTTAARAFAIAVNWNATNASQSLTGLGSHYTRGGP